jgi:hypothetical protein
MIGKQISHLPREIIRHLIFVGIDPSNISPGEPHNRKARRRRDLSRRPQVKKEKHK